ncbi:GNAT family N-acetyltransferase [Staphylococcus shinii]|uniref:GNAT family N-acetyltransferase n=1 Tax=Staphylococcus shinii TaxID=2912228 RepID=UPI003F8656CA
MIRICKVSDTEYLKQIGKKTFGETFRSQNKKENIEAYLKTAFTSERMVEELKNPNSYFYFIYFKNELAGYLKLNLSNAQTEEIEGNNIEIERIYILRKFQKNGLGKELYKQALKLAKDLECENIWLGVWEKNENAIQFYKKLGFYKIGEHVFFMGDEKQIDFIMLKEL